MSVVGIGTDIVSVHRVADLLGCHATRFLDRCFQDVERAVFAQRRGAGLVEAVAGRWAAKEAFLKALGGSIAHIPYRDVAVMSSPGGGPQLVVSGVAAQEFARRGGVHLHLTISHERDFAVATVLIES